MILTVTLNPMLDKTVVVDRLRAGTIHRARAMSVIVGGKGVNVSRQLLRLHCRTVATGLAGGETGRQLRRLLKEEGIPERFVRIAGQTREGVTYREDTGRTTGIFEPPHEVRGAEALELRASCRRMLSRASWLVCSGSSPCAQTDNLFKQLLDDARSLGVPTALDSYGPALVRALKSRPTILKANRQELEATFALRLRTVREMKAFLADTIDGGTAICVVTDGPRPVYAAAEGCLYRIRPPATRSVNATGSGDSMLAGILAALEKRWAVERALAYCVAAGVANASVWAVACARPSTIDHIASAVDVEIL